MGNYISFFAIICSLLLTTSCQKDDDQQKLLFLDIWACLDGGQYSRVTLDEEPTYLFGSGADFGRIFLHNTSYPAEARHSGIEGKVEFAFIIDKDGVAKGFEIISTAHELLSDAVRNTFDQFINGKQLFSPAIYDKEPVKVKVGFPFGFNIE